ncbi:unnamed protein product (macronuclear) [Paramecium tetraurelia]|uniref:Uncharacterized protein n=1 Tax=Paramecium tetraurelia TaxID=5888 RepID=A0C3S5_PARTE|nr:uncharacterized protein GSPATT00034921001 [Paramecium tetraurelia]CAK65442.1 unnamed protein product [Paramecium tetraurelia]|eukprot:XP_001432839.1 hypothetical protein (macronuclear) [Paramecium tetraurelia strain d4-2]
MQFKSDSFDSELTEYLQIEQEFEIKQLFKQLKVQNQQLPNKKSKKIKKLKLNIQTNSIMQRRNVNVQQI